MVSLSLFPSNSKAFWNGFQMRAKRVLFYINSIKIEDCINDNFLYHFLQQTPWQSILTMKLENAVSTYQYCTPTPHCSFLPITQFFRDPVPENSLLFLNFYCECQYETKNLKFSFTPFQSIFGTPCKKIFFCFNQKNLFTKQDQKSFLGPLWSNFFSSYMKHLV